MLVMTLVGNETTLGTLQSIGALVSAVLLYLLGRFTSSRHRVAIFSAGLLLSRWAAPSTPCSTRRRA